ncbi:MAG: MFS transporter [Acidobacteria bacterium]|nr:MFS transporter [Acidobacteriota bacterium]
MTSMTRWLGSRDFFRVLIVSLGHLVHDVYTSFLAPLLPLLIERFQLSFTSAGFLSFLLRVPALFNPLIGSVAERVNLKILVIISPTLTAVGMCLLGVVPDFALVVVLILLTGVSSSFFHVPTPVLLNRLAGRHIGLAMSFFQIGGESARTVGPLVAMAAVAAWTLEGLYRLIPLALVMSAGFYWVLRDIPPVPPRAAHRVAGAILSTLRQDRRLFITLTGIMFGRALSAGTLAAFLPTFLTEQGESLWFAGVSLSIVQAAAMVGVLITGTLSDRIGCRRLLVVLSVAAPLTMVFFLLSGESMLIVSLILLGLFAFSAVPVLLAVIQRRGFDYPVIANGIYMTLNFLMSSTIVVLAGKLSDMVGMATTFTWFAVASVVSVPFALLLPESRTRPE